jgi:hypothetical protein
MFRLATLVAVLLLAAVGTTQVGQYGTPEEAKAMLEKAVAAVKENKAKALDMFNKGEGGFKDRDLYGSCANASDGIVTAHPYLKGEQLKDIKGKKGYPLGVRGAALHPSAAQDRSPMIAIPSKLACCLEAGSSAPNCDPCKRPLIEIDHYGPAVPNAGS